MATIDSNGVLFYQDSDNFTPPASLNLAQSNLSDLLSSGVRFKRVANTTARSALVTSIGLANITTANPLHVWRADATAGKQHEYTTNGTTWSVYDNTDTGWVQLSPAPEIIFIRRVGKTVTVVATGGKNIPSLGRVPVGAFNIVPAEHRPAHDMIGILELRWLTNGVGTLSVDAGGTIWAWNPTPSANSSWYGSITYVM